MVDKDKIRQKIHYIRQELKKLQTSRNLSFDDFIGKPFYVDATLRQLQVAIEAMIDISSHIVAREGWGLLKAYGDGFRSLTEHNILERQMLDTYLKMVKFRNRIVHLYDEINAEEVYRILQENLDDFERFISSILKAYF